MKKKFLLLFILILALGGCSTVELDDKDNDDELLKTFTVSFVMDGATDITPLSLSEGDSIDLPDNPSKEGYTFGGWFTDVDLLQVYSDLDSINSDITLYAKWIPIRTVVVVQIEETILGTSYTYYGVESELNDFNYDYYDFLGWYSDADYNNQISSVTGALENQTIYLKLGLKDTDLPAEEVIDVTTLPYYEYLSDSNPVVTITVKDIGVLKLELFPDVAKNTVDNFIQYIEEEAYTSSTFHRIIEDFMIQGGTVETTNCSINGDFTSNGFSNDLQHYRGVLSMARTSRVNSATSQFFIMHEDSHFLDGEYASFGGLISGFNVLDYIAGVDTFSSDAPLLPIVIESISIELNGYVVETVVCSE